MLRKKTHSRSRSDYKTHQFLQAILNGTKNGYNVKLKCCRCRHIRKRRTDGNKDKLSFVLYELVASANICEFVYLILCGKNKGTHTEMKNSFNKVNWDTRNRLNKRKHKEKKTVKYWTRKTRCLWHCISRVCCERAEKNTNWFEFFPVYRVCEGFFYFFSSSQRRRELLISECGSVYISFFFIATSVLRGLLVFPCARF